MLLDERSMMGLCDGLSHCKLALAFAVLMDLLGASALLLGVFAPMEIKGQDFGDLLVYSGRIEQINTSSSMTGNIDGLTSKSELGHIGSAVDRLARNLSRKFRSHRANTYS
ncbi:hypothetical protein FQN60_007855 [Etheostoma spectabile]|uniref:Uncharacterized protein n=1 Tax=Etheostoma spectabile TaxID=54343 RepID=A0A5J5D0L6_9PERO|nr:hypothetical protein FQN60_007855 [Etheostoma spectabile]